MDRTKDTGLTVAVSVVATWALGLAVPDYQMPPEVAAGVGAIIGPILEDVRKLRRAAFARWQSRIEGGADGA